MTMTSVLRKAAAKGTTKLAEDVQAGRQCSPTQALDELLKVEQDWTKASLATFKLLKWTVSDADTTNQAAQSVPSDVIESLLDEYNFGNVPCDHQRRFLKAIAKNDLGRVTLRGFSMMNREHILALTGANLTVLKLIDCAGFDPCTGGVFESCVLGKIAKNCTALERLEIWGAAKMAKLADVGLAVDGPLSFKSLRVCHVDRCDGLRSIWLKSAVKARLRVRHCKELKSVRAEGNFQQDKHSCTFEDCPQLEVQTVGSSAHTGLRDLTPPEIVAHVRAQPGSGYLYMMPAHDRMSVDYHQLKDFHLVPHSEVDPENYYAMISKAGVLCRKADVLYKFTPLDCWERDNHAFTHPPPPLCRA